MAKKNKAEGNTAVAEKPVEKAAEPEKKMITSTELAARLGTKPTILRRWLRTLPKFQDNGYTRYKWEEDDPFLADASASFEKYKKQSEEKKEARLAEAREKAEKKKAEKPAKETKAKGKKKDEPEEEVEEDEDEDSGDEDSEEGEELE